MAGQGWFVLNARDADWFDGDLGKHVIFESEAARFSQLGINLNVLQPGEPMGMYHREGAQEDLLVLDGDCLLIVEGEERPLKKWDFFHCPAGVSHAIVGAGNRPSLVLAVGARTGHEQGRVGDAGAGAPGSWTSSSLAHVILSPEPLVYPADAVARKHGAAVAEETTDSEEAYKPYSSRRCGYENGWLPE